jgi:regulator of RNase E activity RraA
MTQAAIKRGIKGLVVDGAVRDRSEIIELGFACYARGSVPAGPHKGFGGAIDCAISCGGVAVHPGDLIIADADGVTVVPLARIKETLQAYKDLSNKETRTAAALDDGGTLADIYGVPEVVKV